MGYPAIRSYTAVAYDGDVGTTSHSIELPNEIVAGDYILVIIGIHHAANIRTQTLTWPGGWFPIIVDGYSNETQLYAAYIVANGTEGGTTINLTASNSGSGFYGSYSLYNVAAAPSGTLRSVSPLSPDEPINPPSHTHSYGAADYLAIEAFGTQDVDVTTFSPGYSGTMVYHFACGEKYTSSATEDPGAVNAINVNGYTAATIMIPGKLVISGSLFFGSNF